MSVPSSKTQWLELSEEHLCGRICAGVYGHGVSSVAWSEAFALIEPECFPGSSVLRLPDEPESPEGGQNWVQRQEAPVGVKGVVASKA